MGNHAPPTPPRQHFEHTELLYRRVHRDNVRHGKATHYAFELPDMSCNRETESTAEDACRGFDPDEWGVAAFPVAEIPPRKALHLAQFYQLLARHIPEPGNFAHSEVRVWRIDEEPRLLITERQDENFREGDPDQADERGTPADWLDPDFHMKWRKRIALVSRLVVRPRLAA